MAGGLRQRAVWPACGWWCERLEKVQRGPQGVSWENSIGAGEGNRTVMTSLEDRGPTAASQQVGLRCWSVPVCARE